MEAGLYPYAALMRRHAQQELRLHPRGGKRPGAGRPPSGPRSIHHDTRIRVSRNEPIHVTCRALPRIANLRTDAMYAAIRAATTIAAKHDDFHIVHVSIQRTHLHLLAEARTGPALTRGMCSFLISAARHINAALGTHTRVFERYHARSLRTPREVRNCLAYVLNNWRHHGEHRRATWLVDKYSTAVAFDGWREHARFATPADYQPLTTWPPRVWLLSTGWRRHGLVGVRERPAG
jgi:REP element-mobilizing transposase RayT